MVVRSVYFRRGWQIGGSSPPIDGTHRTSAVNHDQNTYVHRIYTVVCPFSGPTAIRYKIVGTLISVCWQHGIRDVGTHTVVFLPTAAQCCGHSYYNGRRATHNRVRRQNEKMRKIQMISKELILYGKWERHWDWNGLWRHVKSKNNEDIRTGDRRHENTGKEAK